MRSAVLLHDDAAHGGSVDERCPDLDAIGVAPEQNLKKLHWLAGLAVYVGVQAQMGKDIPAFVKVPLPIIDNSNIDAYLARAKDFPADGYIYSPYSLDSFEKLLANQ